MTTGLTGMALRDPFLIDFLERARDRLDPPGTPPPVPTHADHDLNKHLPRPRPQALTAAAVLFGVVLRPEGASVILTRRPASMTRHAGQVAFPGGKLDPGDADVVAAALREAEEEVGLDPRMADVIGQGSAYETVTGFAVTPVVALLASSYIPRPDPHEVDAVFETPLSFLMDPANHERHERDWQGVKRAYYAMPWNGHYIWGATAGMIRALHARLYSD